MTRHFLSAEEQARYAEARLDAVRAMARVASEQGCAFAVVCGDVFDSNHLDRAVVARAVDALASFDIPVYLLPANHDPLNAASVFRSSAFTERKPANVIVLESSDPLAVPGVAAEIVGAPWDSKQPLEDLVARACTGLPARTSAATARVLVGHGAVDPLSPDKESPALIRLAAAERAIADGVIDYIALGDRHSATEVGTSGRIWYAGTPLVTDYTEALPNHALVVEIEPGAGPNGSAAVRVTPHRVGTWSFTLQQFDVNGREEVEAIEAFLDAIPDKRNAVVKLSFRGTINLTEQEQLDTVLERAADVFAALETWERHTDLHLLADTADFDELGLSGYALTTMESLREEAARGGAHGEVAQDALNLLFRLARSGA